MKLSIDQVERKHLQWFVHGAVTEWSINSGAKLADADLEAYQFSTMNKVCAYLFNNATIDGSYSDLQAVLALEAAKVFGTRSRQIRSIARSLTEAQVMQDGTVHLMEGSKDTGLTLGMYVHPQFYGECYPIVHKSDGLVVLTTPFGAWQLDNLY